MISTSKNVAKVVKVLTLSSFDKTVETACSVLKEGKIVAVPTDTIYGIAALAQCNEALKSIYKLKGRDCNKPLAICVGNIIDIPKWGVIQFSKDLLYDLLPGPVTVVLERQPALNPKLNPNVPTIGIRIPKSKFIQNLAVACDEPLALTSANLSSKLSTLAVEEFSEIWPSLDLVIDGGILGHQDPHRLGSTVVDLSRKGFYRIIRTGCSLEKTKKILKRYCLEEMS